MLVEQGLRLRIEYLSGVIAELIDSDARDPRVLRCVASVQSQVVAYFPDPIAIRLGMRSTRRPRRSTPPPGTSPLSRSRAYAPSATHLTRAPAAAAPARSRTGTA